MEELVFNVGFMSHFGISSIESESWKVEKEWEYGLEIWFSDFPTLQSQQGGTHITSGKGGQGTKGIIASSSKIRGVSWFTRVGEVQTPKGLGSTCKEMWTKILNLCLKKSQSMSFPGDL